MDLLLCPATVGEPFSAVSAVWKWSGLPPTRHRPGPVDQLPDHLPLSAAFDSADSPLYQRNCFFCSAAVDEPFSAVSAVWKWSGLPQHCRQPLTELSRRCTTGVVPLFRHTMLVLSASYLMNHHCRRPFLTALSQRGGSGIASRSRSSWRCDALWSQHRPKGIYKAHKGSGCTSSNLWSQHHDVPGRLANSSTVSRPGPSSALNDIRSM